MQTFRHSKATMGILGTALTTTLSYASTQQSKSTRVERPNVILIYLDDMGYGDLSLTGATGFTTPHIDKIATTVKSTFTKPIITV